RRISERRPLTAEAPPYGEENHRGEQLDHGVPGADRLPAIPAARTQRDPGEDRHVVVPGDPALAAGAARRGRDQAAAVRKPGYHHVEEAAQARANDEHVGVRRPRGRGSHAAGAAPSRARCTKRLSSVCRWGASEIRTPPAPTMARTAACAGGSEGKVRTTAPSRRSTWAPSPA